MGRPLKEINETQVYELAKIHCTNVEIARIVGCTDDTLTARFSEVLAKGREDGREKLRRLQWRSAERGNVTMQIWLGKQYLGQKDKSPEEIEAIKGSASWKPTKQELLELVNEAKGEKK